MNLGMILYTICRAQYKMRIGRSLIKNYEEFQDRTFLVVQWVGVCLPMQRARIQSPVWEDPNFSWQRSLCPQLLSLCSGARALKQEKTAQWEAHTPQLESSCTMLAAMKTWRSQK